MKEFDRLVEIVHQLRGPNGCPWDKEQTHRSLARFAIEEAYELEEAIRKEDHKNLQEELGDLLFQSVLHSEISRQNGGFGIEDVLEVLSEKMVRRHPHVFADSTAKTSGDVAKNWEQIKADEKGKKNNPFDIPQSFPSLLRAQKIGKKSKQYEFDWNSAKEVFDKVEEELNELRAEIANDSLAGMEEEFGDLLFSLVQLARHLGFDAESSLRSANQKFISRFEKMLELDPDLKNLSPEEKERLWTRVK